MDDKLLNQIGNLMDEKLKPIKDQLDTVGMKVELVNKKVDQLDKKVDEMHKELNDKIDQAQENTIDALSGLIHEGYGSHEIRIKKIEDQLNHPQTQ